MVRLINMTPAEMIVVPSVIFGMAQITKGSGRKGQPDNTRFVAFMNKFLIYLRWSGIYPLEHKNGTTCLSPFLLAYNIALNVLFIPATSYVAYMWDSSVINTTVRFVNIIIILICVVNFSYCYVRKYKKMAFIYRIIESVEKRLSGLGNYFAYTRPPIFYTLLVILIWLCTVIITSYCRGPNFYFRIFISHYTEFLHTLNLFGFTTLNHAVEVQLTNITEHLLWAVNNHTQRQKKVEICEKLAEIHEDLCTICSEISNFYSMQMLISVTAGFVNFVANAYLCVIGRQYLEIAVVDLFKGVIGLLHAFMVCSSSVTISSKAKKFSTLLYQLMIDDKSGELSGNKKLRLLISMKREVAYSAWGFFDLDYTLIHSMIAAATTYLVILIQFGQIESHPPLDNSTISIISGAQKDDA